MTNPCRKLEDFFKNGVNFALLAEDFSTGLYYRMRITYPTRGGEFIYKTSLKKSVEDTIHEAHNHWEENK